MKKLTTIALLSTLVCPAFAAEDKAATDKNNAVQEPVEQVQEQATVKLSDEERLKLKQDFKDEIKSELKQEYMDAKKSAQEKTSFPDGLQFGVGASALSGLNGFVGYANKNFDSFWAKRFGVRFDFATTQPIESAINKAIDSAMGDDGIEIGDGLAITDGEIDATHYAALIDFYPFGNTWFLGGWRVSAGYAFGDMQMKAAVAGSISQMDAGRWEFELSGQKYAYTGNSVHGSANLDWDYRGPYLGTGFDIGLFGGIKLYLDAGVVFTNKAAELALDIPTDNLQHWNGSEWVAVDVPELESVIDKTLQDAQSELDDFKFYPMVKVGFMYRF